LYTFFILCYNPIVSLIKKLSFAKATAEQRKIKMFVFDALRKTIVSLFSALTKSMDIALTSKKGRAVLLGTFLLFALISYNLPEKYQLLNLIQRRGDARRSNATSLRNDNMAVKTSSAKATAVKGEEITNQGLMNQTPTIDYLNLYEILTADTGRRSNATSLQLGGMLLSPHGELFIATQSVVSDSIKRHTIRNINLADDSITSRTIKNHEVKSQDLNHYLEIQHLTIKNELTVEDAINAETIDFGENTITDQNFTGNWDFNGGNLTTTGTLTIGAISTSGNLDLQNNLILNIGNANTDFTTSGGLNLAGNLNINNNFLVNAVTGEITTGTWHGDIIELARGGTNANLTASNGGIFYSTATAGAILSGTTTANQILLSGASTTPAWSTATYPATTTANQLLYSSALNTVGGLTTTNSGVLVTSATGVPSILGPMINGQLVVGSTGVIPVLATLTGTTDQVVVTNGAGTITLSTSQSINTTSTPQFARLGLGVSADATNILTATSASFTNLSKTLNITHTGAISGTGYAGYFSKTGASTTNVGLYTIATGATNNYALQVDSAVVGATNYTIYANGVAKNYFAGNIGIGTTGPNAKLSFGTPANGTRSLALWENSSDATGFMGFGNDVNRLDIWALGSTPKVTIQSTGNVGIGTTGPGALLEVNGSSVINATSISYSEGLRINVAPNGYTGIHLGGAVASVSGTGADQWTVQKVATTHNFRIYNNGDDGNGLTIQPAGNVGIGTTTPGYKLDVAGSINAGAVLVNGVPVSTGGSTQWGNNGAMIYYNGGNVGIGTTGPDAKLQVNGDLIVNGAQLASTTNLNPALYIFKGGAGSRYGMDLGYAGSNYRTRLFSAIGQDIAFGTLTGGTLQSEFLELVTIKAISGNIGIGTTGPATLLQVAAATSQDMELNISGNSATGNIIVRNSGAQNNYLAMTAFGSTFAGTSSGIARAGLTELSNNNATGFLFRGISNAPVYFATNNLVRMTIKNDGNVGIGTTAPGAKLHVAGNTILDGVAAKLNFYESGAIKWNMYNDTTSSNFLINSASGGTLVTIQQSGNIGIGTTSPGAKLDVNGIIGFSSADGVFTLGGTTYMTLSQYARVEFAKSLNMRDNNIYGSIAAGGSLYLNSTSHATPGNIIMNGNVGIGTTGPGAKLDVTSAAGGTSLSLGDGVNSRLNISHPASHLVTFTTTDEGQGFSFFQNTLNVLSTAPGTGNIGMLGTLTVSGTGNTTIAGNVGIGTTNPGTNLEVWKTAYSEIPALGAYGGSFAVTGGTGWGLLTGLSASGYVWQQVQRVDATATAYPLVLQPTSGNVGIGTTGPNAPLMINKDYTNTGVAAPYNSYTQILQNPNQTTNALHGLGFTTINASGGQVSTGAIMSRVMSHVVGAVTSQLLFYTANNTIQERMRIDESGNVGIGTTSPGQKLQVGSNGDGSVAIANAWSTFSDENFKTNIQTISGALDKINLLRGVTFDWKNSNQASIGFIAQEIEKVFPEMVSTGADGYKSVDYSKMTPVLLEGIKEQQTQITGITDNQNKIVEQLTNQLSYQLADKTLSIDTKINLIGASLDELTTSQIATLKEQIAVQTSDISDLKDQMADIQTNMYIERYDELWSFYQNFELAKVPLKNALENVFEGKIVASDIEALNTIKAKSISVDSISLTDAKTSGRGMIEVGKTEIIIETTYVDSESKIYITSQGSTFGKNLYFDEIVDEQSFKVKIDAPALEKDIKFNWLIVK
jgi:hypothetical protein